VTREGPAISVRPGHDRPERARGCLLTSEADAAAPAEYAHDRPRLDETSRHVIDWADRPHPPPANSGPADPPDTALWLALCQAPDDGTNATDLMRSTGWTRTKLYRQHAGAGRAIGVSGGTLARAQARGGPCE
jgi:hypothetical protein